MWKYEGKPISSHDDLLPECTHFVYLITYTSGQMYIGQKAVRTVRKRPPLKGKKRNRRVLINHPFMDYAGSHECPPELVIAEKDILYQCSDKRAATYLEMALLFEKDVLFTDLYLNQNIGGTMYDNALNGLLNKN